jgi:hypothetical protein
MKILVENVMIKEKKEKKEKEENENNLNYYII